MTYTDSSAARIRIGSSASDCWKACAVPWNEPLSVAGAPSFSLACSIARNLAEGHPGSQS